MKRSKKIERMDRVHDSIPLDYQDIKKDAYYRIGFEKYKYECLAILLGLDTGLRASDLLNLKTDAISYNESKDRYECVSNIKKTGVKNHRTLISHLTYKSFKDLNLPDGYIFTNPRTGNLFTRIWLTKRTKLRYGFSFHTLRKISALRILEVGNISDAQKHLGHKRISSTDHYLKVSENDSLDRIRKLYY